MTDRTVKTTLWLQATGYIQGMDQATRKTRELGSEAEKLAQKRQSLEVLGRGLLAIGLAAAVGVGLAVAKYAEFGQAMSQVNAITQETTANQNLLRDAALDAGGATVFTAKEAANAEEELAKAGLSTSYILGGALAGSLNLAAAGQLEVARSAEITGITLKQFGLDGSQAARVADVLAAGANKAVGGVEELAQGLKFVGPVTAAMNVSLEDTVATLAMFADQGILGEQAGTSLRGMLASLTSPSSLARKEMDRLGITLYDSAGKFLGVENAAGELHRVLGDVSQQERDTSLGILFTNQQLTTAQFLVQGGAETWRDYRTAVDDAGIAQRIAADRMDNLSGDVEKLGGAFDTALIRTGSSANDVLRMMVQSVTLLVDGLGGLPDPLLGAGLAIAAVTAALGLAGGGALLAVPKIAAFRAGLDALHTTLGAVALKAGLAGGALALAGFVIGTFVTAAVEAKGRTDSFKDSLDQATGAVTEYSRAVAAKQLQDAGAFELAKNLGISLDLVTDAAMGQAGAFEQVVAEGGKAINGNSLLASNLDSLRFYLGRTNGELGTAKTQWEEVQGVTAEADGTTLSAADAYKEAAGEVGALESELSTLIDTINKANGVGQDAVSTNAAYQQALADIADYVAQAQAGVEGFSLGIDESTAAGSANADMLADLANKSQEAAQAALNAGGSVDTYGTALQTGRQQIYDTAIALGASADEAQRLTDKIYAAPTSYDLKVAADITAASRTLDNFFALYNGRVIRASVQTNGTSYTPGFGSGGYTGDIPATAIAGVVHGREFVNDDDSTAKPANRAAMEFMNAGGDISNYMPAQRWQSAPPQYVGAPTPVPARGSFADRPIVMDGSIVGVLQTMANGEARLVFNHEMADFAADYRAGGLR